MNMQIIPADQSDQTLSVNDAAASQNPAVVYLSTLTSAHSITNMRSHLNKIARILTNNDKADAFSIEWGAIRYPHANMVKAQLKSQHATATVNVMLAALRGVLKQAWLLGYMSAEDYYRTKIIENVKGTDLPAGRDLASGEIKALVSACMADDSAAGIRDAAIIGVLKTCGLRRAELATLMLADFDSATGKIIVQGKGRKERTVYATGGTHDALMDWLSVRGDSAGFLFVPISQTGVINATKGITPQAVRLMLVKRGKEAGVKNFSPHDFRRTFAGDMLKVGVDISLVAKIMGHSNVETTARYDRRPEEAKLNAAKELHYPYQRRTG